MADEFPRLTLASASPRRADLLASAGFSFTVEPANVDESVRPREGPEEYVHRVAMAKARAVSNARAGTENAVVLAADTAVVLDGDILGKAETPDEAFRMLKRLSGVVHSVLTGVVLVCRDIQLSSVDRTRVHLLPISDDEIQAYVATREPIGKAGGYAIQGRAARFVDWIEGSWSNVVGLPVATVDQMLKNAKLKMMPPR